MSDVFFKKWYKKNSRELKMNIKNFKSSKKPLNKMNTGEIRKYYKSKIKIWELVTSRNQDRSDEFIDQMSKDDILKDIKFFEDNGQGLGIEWLVTVIESIL